MRASLRALLVTAALIAAACGSQPAASSRADASASPDAAFPVTVDTAAGPVTIEEQPDAIVSLSPTATEMLFAIDAGDQVIAVDDQSTYPPDAPVTDLSGFEPNVEAIATYHPDLVVISFDPGRLVKGLEKLGIPTLSHDAAATLDDTYRQIEELGAATGNGAAAGHLVEEMKQEIDEIARDADVSGEGATYYYELDDTYFTATSETFVGSLFALLELENIADAADKDGTGYPQLSAEYIVDADPDLIFLADTKCCGQSAETVADRAGWSQITAVRNGDVVELDDDLASRWGPRVVELLRTAADAVAALGS